MDDSLSIFVLEDDDNLRAILVETLEDQGWQVDSASRGQEAVSKVSLNSCDLLIVDVRMEGISGLDAFSLLKQKGIDLPCLVITGFATEEDSVRAIRLGVGDYLRKPFEMKSLLTCVRRLSAQGAHQREQRLRELGLERLAQSCLDQLSANQEQIRRSMQYCHDIGQGLNLPALDILTAQLALLALQQTLPQPQALPHGVPEILKAAQECWNGTGPDGLRGEEIPLLGRVVRLAREAAVQGTQVHRAGQGSIDPYLLEYLDKNQVQEQANQLLAWASTVLDAGDEAGAIELLGGIVPDSLAAAQLLQWHLLQLRLTPSSERSAKAAAILTQVSDEQAWSYQRAIGLQLLQWGFESAAPLLLKAYQGINPHQSPASKRAITAQLELALWRAGQRPFPGETALATLQEPAHQPLLVECLAWLWKPLLELRYQSQQPWSDSESLLVMLRHYSSGLARQVSGFPPALKNWLSDSLSKYPWASHLLESLSSTAATGSQAVASDLPLLRIESFGHFALSVGEERLNDSVWRGARNKYFFAYLANAQRPVSEEKLIDIFWNEDIEKGKKGVYNTLAHLRKSLRPLNWKGNADFIARTRDLLSLNPAVERWHDADEFSKLLQQAQSQLKVDKKAARLLFKDALALYKGPFLDGCYLDWAVALQSRFEQEFCENAVVCAQLDLELGEAAAAVDQAQRVLSIDNCHQLAAQLAMKAHITRGRPEEAIRLYDQLVRTLKIELGVEPTIEIFELYQRAKLAV